MINNNDAVADHGTMDLTFLNLFRILFDHLHDHCPMDATHCRRISHFSMRRTKSTATMVDRSGHQKKKSPPLKALLVLLVIVAHPILEPGTPSRPYSEAD